MKKCEEKYANRKRSFSKLLQAIKNAIRIGKQIAVWPSIQGNLAKCKHGANIYYDAVASFGQTFFTKKSPRWCAEACAIKAGDPNM